MTQKTAEDDFHFEPRQMHTDAAMRPVAPADMIARVTPDVELFRRFIVALVVIG